MYKKCKPDFNECLPAAAAEAEAGTLELEAQLADLRCETCVKRDMYIQRETYMYMKRDL